MIGLAIEFGQEVDAALAQEVVREYQADHGLDDRHCARQNAGVVAALGLQGHLVAFAVDRLPKWL